MEKTPQDKPPTASQLEPGRPLFVTQYTRLSTTPDGRHETGPLRIVGTALTYLDSDDVYYRVRVDDGAEGWVWSARVSALDPRHFFAVRGRPIRGYLVSGMYPDLSGGSLDDFALASHELGEVSLSISAVRTIEVRGPGDCVLALADGSRYAGAPTRAWLVNPTLRIMLDKAAPMMLERCAPEPAAPSG